MYKFFVEYLNHIEKLLMLALLIKILLFLVEIKNGKKYDFSPFMKLPLSSSICQEWILCWLNLFCPKEEKSCHKTRNEKKIQLWKPRVYIARILIFDIYNAKLVALSILILYSPEHGIFFCDKISKEKIYIKIGFRPKKKMLRTVIFW